MKAGISSSYFSEHLLYFCRIKVCQWKSKLVLCLQTGVMSNISVTVQSSLKFWEKHVLFQRILLT